MAPQHGLFRSRTDKVFGGVCGGIAKSLNTDTFLIRLVFVLLFIFAGSGLLLYLILWIALPEEPLNMFQDYNPASGEQPSPETEQQSAIPDTPVFVPRKNNGALIVGIVFIGIGIIFLADRFIPRIHFSDLWPILIVIAGIVLIASSFLNNKRA
jgi:phage shock protein PspC (stress-responsive transcriptional regulator)